MSKVGVSIVYSSINKIFVDTLINECLKFTDDIVLAQSATLYNGETDEQYNNDKITKVTYNHEQTYDHHLKHNLARLATYELLKNEYILFLDADEIPEGKRFKNFIDNGLYYPSYKIANYFYYKSPQYQAQAIHDSPLLITKNSVNVKELTQNTLERDGLVNAHTIRMSTHDNLPLIHHYSWVNTKKNIAKKIATWGHKNDKNWKEVIDSWDDFNEDVRDPVLGLFYRKVPNKFNIKI